MVRGDNMNELIQPNEKLKKKMIYLLSISEFVVCIMLLNNMLHTYSLSTSLVLVTTLITASIIFNIYMWKRVSREYIMIGYTYIEWNGIRFEWENIKEIRLRRENDKPMFLILKYDKEYIKLPLRLLQEQAPTIIGLIKSLELEITES
jgi:hypothetical protein